MIEILELDKETISNLKLQCSQATKKEKKEIILSLCSVGLEPKEISKIAGISAKAAKGYIDFYTASGGEINARPQGSYETLEEGNDTVEDEVEDYVENEEEDIDKYDFSSEIEKFNSIVNSGLDFLNYILYDDIVLELSAYDKAIELIKHRYEDKLDKKYRDELSLALYNAQNKRRAIKHLNELRLVLLSKLDDNTRNRLTDMLNVLNGVSGEVVQNRAIFDSYIAQVKRTTTKQQRDIISGLVNGVADIKFEA